MSERRLRERIDELELALLPFAQHGAAMEGCDPTDEWETVNGPDGESSHTLTVRDYFNASAAMSAPTPADPCTCGTYEYGSGAEYPRRDCPLHGDEEA